MVFVDDRVGGDEIAVDDGAGFVLRAVGGPELCRCGVRGWVGVAGVDGIRIVGRVGGLLAVVRGRAVRVTGRHVVTVWVGAGIGGFLGQAAVGDGATVCDAVAGEQVQERVGP